MPRRDWHWNAALLERLHLWGKLVDWTWAPSITLDGRDRRILAVVVNGSSDSLSLVFTELFQTYNYPSAPYFQPVSLIRFGQEC